MLLRKIALICLATTLLASLALGAIAQSPRATTPINAFWKFNLADEPASQNPDFNDSSWQSVGLPHSFSIPYFMSQEFPLGYGWYRKHLNLPQSIANKRLFIDFDGAFQETELFVNGKLVGTHKGGYTGFSFDITSAVKPGDNLLAVRVSNNWNPRLAPRAGEHVFSGGLYRNVYLTVVDPLHVAYYGTFVTTPDISADKATVNVKTEVTNDSPSEKSVTVKQTVLDPDGKIVAEAQLKQSIAAGKTQTLEITTPAIANPKLWSPDHPTLYSVKTTVLDGDRVCDEYTSPLGFRWIKWTADQGFFLNGQHLYILGANVHQDAAGWGDARTDADIFRDVKMVKDAGFNFIRGSHYPHAPAFSKACDELGILFWSENDFWSTSSGRPEGYFNGSGYPTKAEDQPDFEASGKAQLAEMIRIHRNHPSIVVWSMCNEPFFSANSVMDKVRAYLKDLVDETHKLDPTRLAAVGGVQRPTNAGRLDKIGDIAGYNGDGASIALFANPGIPNIVSEYGSTNVDRPGKYEPGFGDLPRTPGIDRNKPYDWRQPWRSGEVLWCAFDHGSIMSNFGKMGMIDYFRIPKRQYYWYVNEYAKIAPPEWPAEGTAAGLKITASKTQSIKTDGTDDAWLLITVVDKEGKPLSNSPAVDLSIVKGPGEFPTGASIQFDSKSDIRILDGQAAITVRSYYAGAAVIRATSEGLTPAEITLNFVGDVKFEEGKTPAVAARPYVKYKRPNQTNPPITFGHNSPTFPSSALANHPGAHATDEDASTYWQPTDADNAPALVVDTERFINLAKGRITFNNSAAYKFTVEISDDQQTWKPVADMTQNTKPLATYDIAAREETAGRFIRIQFPKTPTLQITSVEFTGTIKQ